MNNNKILVVLLVTAFMLRFVGIWYGLPSMYNSDEPDNIIQALGYGAKGSLEPTYFGYPTLYSYVLFLVYGLYFAGGLILGAFDSALDFGAAYFLDPTGLLFLGRMLSVVLGTVGIFVVYKTGRRFFPDQVGLFAAALLAASFVHSQVSHWILLEAAVVFMSALALYLILRYRETPTLRHNFWASLVVGLAVSTKYNAGFLFVPLFMAVIFRFRKEIGQLPKQLGVAAAAMVLGFLVGSPYWLLSFTQFFSEFKLLLSQTNHGLSGHFSSIPVAWPLWEMVSSDWTVGFLLVAGLIYAVFQRTRQGIILLSFAVPTFLLAGTWSRADLHYLLPIFPALAVLAAVFLNDVLAPIARRALRVSVVGLVFLIAFGKIVYYDVRLTQPDSRAVAEQWIEREIPENSVIAYENYVYGPNLFDPARFLKNELESQLLPTALKQRLLEERRKRISYNLVNFRKDFRPRNSQDYDLGEEFASDPYLRKILSYRLPQLSTLRKAGVEYLVISSDNYERYFKGTPPNRNSGAWLIHQNGRTFYQNIFNSKELTLVKELKSTTWSLGPTVQVYKFGDGPEGLRESGDDQGN